MHDKQIYVITTLSMHEISPTIEIALKGQKGLGFGMALMLFAKLSFISL